MNDIKIANAIEANKKVTWKTLSKIITSDHTLDVHMQRSPDVQRLYYQSRAIKRRFYSSFDDYIKISILNFGSYTDDEGKIRAYHTPTSHEIVCCENLYPYNLRKGIKHWNLWAIRQLHNEHDIQQEIMRFLPHAKKVYWFVNSVENMSVPHVWHCHIFWKWYMYTIVLSLSVTPPRIPLRSLDFAWVEWYQVFLVRVCYRALHQSCVLYDHMQLVI